MKFTVEVIVTYKESVLEPQGQAIILSYQRSAIQSNKNIIKNIRVGKHILLQIEASSEKEAIEESKKITESLLHNPVMEKYQIKIHSKNKLSS